MTKPATDEDDKKRLRGYIVNFAERIVESCEVHRKDGKEPSLSDLTEAARVLCQIYGLLEKTGDDKGGQALNDYKRQFSNPGDRRGTGKR